MLGAKVWRLDLEDKQATPRSSNPVDKKSPGGVPNQNRNPSSGNSDNDGALAARRGPGGPIPVGRGVPVWLRGRGNNGNSEGTMLLLEARISGYTKALDRLILELASILMVCYLNKAKKHTDHFAKLTRYLAAKEIRNELTERRQGLLQQLRQRPDSSITFSETMLFLWPEDEIPVETALGKDLEALDAIREEFGYYIYLYKESPDEQKYIRVDGHDHGIIIEIVKRFRAKWANLVTEMGIKTKLYLVRIPNVDLLKTEIGLVECRRPGCRTIEAVPVLFGGHLYSSDLRVSFDRGNLLSSKNELRLRSAVNQALQSVRFLVGHVRMRVNFGKFVLENYRVPSDSKPRYSFEEFRNMLFYGGTKGRLIPGLGFKRCDGDLITRCSQASDILTPFDPQVELLEDNKPFYAVNIEFEDVNEALLRLEAEFRESRFSPDIFEVSQRRWVKPHGDYGLGDKRPPLQIGVVDFEKSDWQLEIKALDFQELSTIEKSLKSFAHSVQFKSGPTDGLRGAAKQRVTFSDFISVSKVTEKSALRYCLKGSRYIFELARYDTYHPAVHSGPIYTSSNYRNQMNQTAETTWGASIFHDEWDNMLGKIGSFRIGEAADWNASLITFFPYVDDVPLTDVNAGFNQFIHLVNQVALLLAPERGSDVTERFEVAPSEHIKPTKTSKVPNKS
ncbi:hypothetical protein PAAG_03050 [Paracoccidioides lutzii Pb01]|uniref:DUF7905 domain-containing protein n=1 Tax=Paracoccidioides lutzii (strain ATCC MYA-826 / Pb01) TaxID=502779 RepID=C1GY96_PARBA|nr:hypothetical protein PAAG_03050 [Paracoccidioides lutzii Pb01]EEH41487.2 hypothetical protein PAAG_03050 [Paracoccidioides lutzii Pb01]